MVMQPNTNYLRKLVFLCVGGRIGKKRQNDCPLYLTEHIPIFEPTTYSLRSNHPSNAPFIRTERFK